MGGGWEGCEYKYLTLVSGFVEVRREVLPKIGLRVCGSRTLIIDILRFERCGRCGGGNDGYKPHNETMEGLHVEGSFRGRIHAILQ